MKRFFSFIFIFCCLLSTHAQEIAHTITDKECYLTGERLHIRIDITDQQQKPSDVSKVACVELNDANHICAQGMAQLTDGTGWADIALPATMHSGNYMLSVYTKAMRNQPQEVFFRKIISVVNPLRVLRADNIIYYPLDSLKTEDIAEKQLHTTQNAGTTYTINLPKEWQGCTVSLTRQDLFTPDYSKIPDLKPLPVSSKHQSYLPEAEGHIVVAKPTTAQTIEETRLVMVGRMAAIYDGQWQADGTWHYYTHGLNGTLPTIISSYDTDGKPVNMEIVSPFAKVLPLQLPALKVFCSESDLQRRSLSAQREQAITDWQTVDSLQLSSEYLSAAPHHIYDLDEYTKFSTVREILIEFINGVNRAKIGGVNHLFTIDPATKQYSRWPALVLLDGMPIHDIDDILEYDARLLKYVQIYTDRYTFGSTICQGIISFISQRGRLSNFKMGEGSRLVSYQFPQDHPNFIYPANNNAGTLYWNPCVTSSSVSIKLPSDPGTYNLVRQRYLSDGSIEKITEEITIK